MAILKHPIKKGFCQLPNDIITDTKLSHGAVRVAAYLFSRPDGWEIRNESIASALSIKDKGSVSKYLGELLTTGWINRCRQRTEFGKLGGGFDYMLNLTPNPQTEKPRTLEKPVNGKIPAHNNTDQVSNTDHHLTHAHEEKPLEGFEAVQNAAKMLLQYFEENPGQREAMEYTTAWKDGDGLSFNEEIVKWLFYSDNQQMLTNPVRFVNKFGFWLVRAKQFNGNNNRKASGYTAKGPGGQLFDADTARRILERAMQKNP